MTQPLTGTLIDLFNPDLYADIPPADARKVTISARHFDRTVTEETRRALSQSSREAHIRRRHEGRL